MRLELTGATVVFVTALAVGVATPRDAGLAGFALTSALSLTGTLSWMVRQTTELEVNMNSGERREGALSLGVGGLFRHCGGMAGGLLSRPHRLAHQITLPTHQPPPSPAPRPPTPSHPPTITSHHQSSA